MKSPLRLSASFVAVLLCSLCPVLICAAPAPLSPAAPDVILIPGPLRSFLRMAGISQKVAPADVLPLLAHNVYIQGYHQGSPTEFLILIDRYVHQARELQILAGPTDTIRVSGCDDAGTLIQILGYRLRPGCGQKNFSLETANPERAFLTIDSGFPLNELEESLQKGVPFTYSYPATPVPVLFRESDWVGLNPAQRRSYGSLVDVLLNDPSVSRLYWALAKQDAGTRTALQHAPGLHWLLPYAGVLDFYGNQISIRSGRVVVPGGAAAEPVWKDLVGASPDTPGDFIGRLLAKDTGWLAAYYDALSRTPQAQQAHLTAAPRMKRLYEAFRGNDSDGTATRGVFRKAPELLVLFTRIQWDADGQPHVPGDLDAWKEILHQKSDAKVVREWSKRSASMDRPDQLLEAMTAFSRMESDSGPLQVYLMLSEIDHRRAPDSRLSPATVRLMASNFFQFNTWFLAFSEFPGLNDASIARFLNVADTINRTSNQALRGNALGSFQATIGLWQILARQGQIPGDQINASWQKMIDPFATISSPAQLFDAAHSSLAQLVQAAGGANSSEDVVVDLLAGPRQDNADGQKVHAELSRRINAVLNDQRLVSLDTLFSLSDGLKAMAENGAKGDNLLPLAAELHEFDLPRPIFTNSEKISWAPAVYTNHHAELQIKTDLTRVIKGPATRAQLETARGQLAPFLRDTLVGLNYAYYEPPGAQILHHNPLFVRSHDFLGVSVLGADRLWGTPVLLGAGTPAGGGAFLMGSLSNLSYALATTEEDFIAPENVQALIWKELVPVLLVDATLPRWWSVTPNELHAVTLYQRSGEELLTASAKDEQLRHKVIEVLSDRMAPQHLEQIQQALLRPTGATASLTLIMPAETSYLAAEFRKRYPDEAATWGPASLQLNDLRSRYPTEANWERISNDFGVPHPTLARTNAREVLNVRPFPFFGAYSSHLFGESWESSNLYWARLADETGYSPAALNNLVPELTRHMIAKIFATDLEDWPAMLRAMQETGDEFRRSKSAALPAASTIAPPVERTIQDTTAQ